VKLVFCIFFILHPHLLQLIARALFERH